MSNLRIKNIIKARGRLYTISDSVCFLEQPADCFLDSVPLGFEFPNQFIIE